MNPRRCSLARFSSLAGALAFAAAMSLTQGCIIVFPWDDGVDDSDDQDGDGYASWIDCDDFNPAIGDECGGEGEGEGIDLDGDGLDELEESDAGTDAERADSDGDGDGDGSEVDCGSDPTDVLSLCAPADSDGDGLSDDQELARGTDPLNADTDGDGDGDGEEEACASSPLDAQFTCPVDPDC